MNIEENVAGVWVSGDLKLKGVLGIFNKLCVAYVSQQTWLTTLYLLDFYSVMMCCPGTYMLDIKRVMWGVPTKTLAIKACFLKE